MAATPATGAWACAVCTLENQASSAICDACSAPQPGTWDCASCTLVNADGCAECIECGAKRVARLDALSSRAAPSPAPRGQDFVVAAAVPSVHRDGGGSGGGGGSESKVASERPRVLSAVAPRDRGVQRTVPRHDAHDLVVDLTEAEEEGGEQKPRLGCAESAREPLARKAAANAPRLRADAKRSRAAQEEPPGAKRARSSEASAEVRVEDHSSLAVPEVAAPSALGEPGHAVKVAETAKDRAKRLQGAFAKQELYVWIDERCTIVAELVQRLRDTGMRCASRPLQLKGLIFTEGVSHNAASPRAPRIAEQGAVAGSAPSRRVLQRWLVRAPEELLAELDDGTLQRAAARLLEDKDGNENGERASLTVVSWAVPAFLRTLRSSGPASSAALDAGADAPRWSLMSARGKLTDLFLRNDGRFRFILEASVQAAAQYVADGLAAQAQAPYDSSHSDPLDLLLRVALPRMDGGVRQKRTCADMWRWILLQIPGFTEDSAAAVAAAYPCLSALVKAYRSSATSAPQKASLLADLRVGRGPAARRLGPKLSAKVFDALYGATAAADGARLVGAESDENDDDDDDDDR